MTHGGDTSARTPPEDGPQRRRVRASTLEALVTFVDERGRMETQPCDIDLIRRALDENSRRRRL